MPYRCMAVHAANGIRLGHVPMKHLVDHVLVTLDAVLLENPTVLLLDHNRFVEVLQREALGVMVSIVCLGNILADEVVRKMTVDARGGTVVTRLLPRVVLRGHDVTVGTRPGIRAEIGEAFGVMKRVGANTNSNPQENSQKTQTSLHHISRLGVRCAAYTDLALRNPSTRIKPDGVNLTERSLVAEKKAYASKRFL